MNLLIISGNLGADAEVKFTSNGKPVTTFSMAVKSGWGENQKTTWVRCDYWGERGEKVAPYLTKGSKPTVTGEISLDEFEGQNGKVTVLKLNVRDVELPPKAQSNDMPHSSPQPQQNEGFADSIPF